MSFFCDGKIRLFTIQTLTFCLERASNVWLFVKREFKCAITQSAKGQDERAENRRCVKLCSHISSVSGDDRDESSSYSEDRGCKKKQNKPCFSTLMDSSISVL